MTDPTTRVLWTTQRVAHKVAWEGGTIATLDYGLRSDDIEPGPLRDEWARAEALYDELVPHLGVIDMLIRKARVGP